MQPGYHLINPDTDAEMYRESCPTLGTDALARYSRPEMHDPVIYSFDNGEFAARPELKAFLRPQFIGEFDPYSNLDEFQRKPILWVLVNDLGKGIHERTPRWRGRSFWKDYLSNDELALVLVEISGRYGLSLSDWMSYVYDRRASDSRTAREVRAKRNKGNTAN